MRMIVTLVALATPGLAFAADTNPKATLTCELVDEGRRTKLPAKRVRLEAPVECKLSVAGAARPEPFAARLAPDQDFVGCIDFVIEAVLTAPGAEAKPAWSKKMQVKQYCPD